MQRPFLHIFNYNCILLLIEILFGSLSAQELSYNFCNEAGSDFISIEIDELEQDVRDFNPDIFYENEAVYITESYHGIIKIINPSTNPEIQGVCSGISGIEGYYEIAVNSQEDLYLSTNNNPYGSTLLKLGEDCSVSPITHDFSYAIQAMSFDKSDNLYVGNTSNSSIVYRADAGASYDFYEWHDFGQGEPSGDFVEKDGFFYIAWNIGSSDYLYKITVDSDKQYISHVNLGQIRDRTYGLANEYGILYGVTPDLLYKIDEENMQTTTIEHNPSNDGSRRWWGAAGLHEAVEIGYQFFHSIEEAESQINPLSGTIPLSSDQNHTIFVRIDNITAGTYEILPIAIIITQPPVIELPESLSFCKSDSIVLDSSLNENQYQIQWYKEDTLIAGATQSSIVVDEPGRYQVEVNHIDIDCASIDECEVVESDIFIENVSVIGQNAEVWVQGNFPPYQFSISEGEWQYNPNFESLSTGRYEMVARNSLGCLSEVYYFDILGINSFTPNNDGVNDVFYFPLLKDYSQAQVLIFDRYGKQIYQSPLDENSYWDGFYKGRNLPTGTYWYQLWEGPTLSYQAYVFLKNY